MSLSRAVDTMDDMSWCPTPSCGYAFVKDSNELNCPLCHKAFCLDCRVDMHFGQLCKDYMKDKKVSENDDEIIRLLQNVV